VAKAKAMDPANDLLCALIRNSKAHHMVGFAFGNLIEFRLL